jgi:hypothetical protein
MELRLETIQALLERAYCIARQMLAEMPRNKR